MEIYITKPDTEDAEGIQKVFYETWLNTYPNEEYGITTEDLKYRHEKMLTEESFEKRRKHIAEQNSKELFLVAKNNKSIVGVCYVEKEEGKNVLRAMYVLPEFQGKGIGTKFWNEAKVFFDKDKDIIVDVAVYNTKAIDFYKKLGFVDTEERFTEERFRMKSGSIIPEMRMVIKFDEII